MSAIMTQNCNPVVLIANLADVVSLWHHFAYRLLDPATDAEKVRNLPPPAVSADLYYIYTLTTVSISR